MCHREYIRYKCEHHLVFRSLIMPVNSVMIALFNQGVQDVIFWQQSDTGALAAIEADCLAGALLDVRT